ncbi:MAG: CRISPR-associated RAMP protein Csx10 [Thermoflexales bacterium]|nr:CRISPR-associated RAMP protein Csx10 [Thermoflexales bacterium]
MWLKIEPQEPILVGEVRADSQFLVGQTYIPGRVLRGAWAEWLAQQGLEDTRILETVGRVRLGNFFPAAEMAGFRYALPLPMSAMSCKKAGGFRSEPLPERHGVVDTLLPHLAYHLLEQKGARFSVPFSLICTKCRDRLEAYGGFYAVYDLYGTERFVLFRPRFHAQTKVALSRHRRASAEGMLYTASALSPYVPAPDREGAEARLVFVGRVDAEDYEALKEALGKVALGALHTRGYGKVALKDAEVDLPPLRERLEAFNKTLKALWQDLRRLAANGQDLPNEPPAGVYFSVDLLAPGVFRERSLPTLVPSLTLGGQTLRPIFWMTRPDMASGWSNAWGLPKPTHLAARMGSVYVYCWDGPKEELLPLLQALEKEGIGGRRDEGFGECLVCHPFHQEVEER